ncbi:MAG: DUF2029 domain-containing protein [Bacteroidetes bacterium]|nr:DUF2029 domain-containing protein [Bacteroidota bacterium]
MRVKNNSLSRLYSTNYYFALGIILIFSIVFLSIEVYNGRFWQSDFTVYYKAAQRILGGQNLFGIIEDGHYIFKYSPFSAVIFIPFTILPITIAKYIYWFVYTSIIISGFYLAFNLASRTVTQSTARRSNNIILLGALVLVVHFQRELHLGQVNQLLLVLYLLVAYYTNKNEPTISGILLAASIFIKPFGLIFIPYFIVKGRYKELGYLFLFGIIFFFVPLIFYSFEEFLNQNALWLNELAIELGNKQSLLLPANHTIFSVIARYSPLSLISFTPLVVKVYQILILSTIVIMVLLFIKKGRGVENAEVSEFALLISIIPLLSFTSQNAFGFVSLVVFILLINFAKFSKFEKVLSIIGMVLLGGNYYDIWGSTLSGFFNDISLVSVGTLLLLFILFRKRFQKVL